MGNEMDVKAGGNIRVTNQEAIELQINAIWLNRQLPVKTRYWLSRIADKIKKIAEAANRERMQIINDFCVKDEHGKPKIAGNKYVFDSPEKESEANKAIEQLSTIENILPWPRPMVDVGTISDKFELSAADMMNAERVVEFVCTEEQPQADKA